MRAAFRFRLRVILGAIVCVAVLIVVRLYFIDVVHGEEYTLKADRQYVAVSNALFDRGAIYFTRKDGTPVSAATLATGFLIAINPQTIADPEAVYARLSSIASDLPSKESFMRMASNKQAVYVEVAHRVPTEAGRALAAEDISGVEVLRERWVTYPGGELSAQTIGIVAMQATDEDLRGRTGLEAYYEQVLTRSGDGLYKNFFAELFSNIGNALVNARDAREGDVITTLEPEVITRLASNLQKVHDKYQSQETGGIILDPSTGEIIAMVTLPTYDANDLSGSSQVLLANPLVEHVYEFGSIMKALTMAAALDAGVVTKDSTYNDRGCTTLDTSTICNFDLKARGVVAMQEILSQSLNLGAAHLAAKLGNERVRAYFEKLGFGEKTNIDLPFETSGLIKNLQSPRDIEYATAAFGQGVAVTPVEMIRALCTLANAGKLPALHIGDSIRLDSGITKDLEPQGEVRQVFAPESARQVSEMLTKVVDESLAKGTLKIPSMSVAAKTGTSELTKPGGGYYDDRFFHSFFGYFPSYAPRFIILLYTNDPKGVQYASETLTGSFMDLVHFLIEYYDVPPDRAEKV